MNAGLETDAQFGIGHVLFMDIVGYSKRLVDKQSDCSDRLNQIVRNTDRHPPTRVLKRCVFS